MICKMETQRLTITPLDDKVIVELPKSVSDQDKSHLIQLLRHHDKTVYSTVVAVGPGKVLGNGVREKMLYEAGQTVYFPAECEKTSPRFKVDDVEYMVLIQRQVLCFRQSTENSVE